jgi:hypothetical protein
VGLDTNPVSVQITSSINIDTGLVVRFTNPWLLTCGGRYGGLELSVSVEVSKH